jgi:adenylate cyclase
VATLGEGATGTANARVELLRTDSKAILFSKIYDFPAKQTTNYALLDAVNRAASDIAQPFGAILATEHEDQHRTDDIDCILRAYDYYRKPGKEELQFAKVCLRWMITSRPNSHVAYALLSSLMLEPYRDGYKPRSPVVYANAIEMARTALRLAPDSARSHHALMKALFVAGFPDDALKEGQLAVSLNPNDSDIVSEYGCKLIYRGDLLAGTGLLREVEGRVSLASAQHRFCRFLAAYLQNDQAGIRRGAADLVAEKGMLALIASALTLARSGDMEGARRVIDEIIAFSPGFAAEPKATLLRRGWEETIVERVYQDLLRSGLEQQLSTSTLPREDRNDGSTIPQ